jgi:hypothetical protein
VPNLEELGIKVGPSLIGQNCPLQIPNQDGGGLARLQPYVSDLS